jgi:ParB-like chromosome segregation protein Spo0J
MMATGVRIGFEQATLELPLDRLSATRSLGKQFRQMERYKRILASIREIGLVEPLVVHPPKGAAGAFLLLDGHLRLEALRELGVAQARCLVSTDDEGYTYNRHVNRISTFQEHFMVMKALNAGVSEERLARALNVDVRRIREKRDLLRGICPEAVAMLKKRDVAASAVYYFRQVKPVRQVAMAQAMIDAGNFTRSYAFALYAATRRDMLVEPERPRDSEGVAPVDLSRIEKETTVIEQDVARMKDDLSQNSLNLSFLRAYLRKLLDNARIVRFLSQHHPEVLEQFQRLVATEALDG